MSTAIATALTFVWLGMVLAISFLEAPLKFRAPGITVPLGLGIGRLVFRALNGCEVVLLLGLVGCALLGDGLGRGPLVGLGLAAGSLGLQQLLVRPRLTRRSDAVLAGADAPRSHAHLAYVGLELVKVAALLTAGILLLG